MTTPSLSARLAALATLSHSSTYAQTVRHGPPSSSTDQSYTASLTAATRDLRQRIIDTELAISSLAPPSPSSPSSSDAAAAAAELHANDAAFRDADYIPPADSPLNNLLAYRSVLRTITSHSASLAEDRERLAVSTRLVVEAEAAVAEERGLRTALETKVAELEDRTLGRREDLVAALQGREKEVRRKMARTMKALTGFVDGVLTEMLETEEAGGPVVGMGEAGKMRREQKTIEEAWKVRREEGGGVGVEMKDLLERLMNESLHGGGYVEIERESAAARFLVRSRVAVFHPRDARRVRLVDFGGTFEDA